MPDPQPSCGYSLQPNPPSQFKLGLYGGCGVLEWIAVRLSPNLDSCEFVNNTHPSKRCALKDALLAVVSSNARRCCGRPRSARFWSGSVRQNGHGLPPIFMG